MDGCEHVTTCARPASYALADCADFDDFLGKRSLEGDAHRDEHKWNLFELAGVRMASNLRFSHRVALPLSTRELSYARFFSVKNPPVFPFFARQHH
jgi:hypothetical protein